MLVFGQKLKTWKWGRGLACIPSLEAPETQGRMELGAALVSETTGPRVPCSPCRARWLRP